MPSQLHEVMVMLLRNSPELAPTLLREALHVVLPTYTEVRLESADFASVVPTSYSADLVVLLCDERPVLGIVAEVQLRSDEDKRYSWPVYVSTLRARIRCDCVLLVLTPSAAVAHWAAAPIRVGAGHELRPLVVGPAGVPVVRDVAKASQNIELSVLSAIAYGKGDVATAVAVAAAAMGASSRLDEDRRSLYLDLIEAALSQAARKAFEMLPQDYQFTGPTALRAIREGRLEGKLEGQTQGEADAVCTILEARGLALSEAQRAQIVACTDLATVKNWVRRAVTVNTTDELFEP